MDIPAQTLAEMYFVFLCSLTIPTAFCASLQSLRQSVLSNLKSMPKDNKFYPAAMSVLKDFDKISIPINTCVFQCAEQLQQAVGELRGFPRFALFDQKWTLWSVAHDQAVTMDRITRIYRLSAGEPHSMNIDNIERSAYLMANALIYTLKEGTPEDVSFVLKRIAKPMCCVAKQSQGLDAMATAFSKYAKWDLGVAKSALFYVIIGAIYLLIVAYIIQAKAIIQLNKEE